MPDDLNMTDAQMAREIRRMRVDQQEIMRINNSLRETMLAIKALVVGDRVPNWHGDFATTQTRTRIADLIDGAVR